MYINCAEKLRHYIEKESKRVGRWGIYIINLVAKLTGMYILYTIIVLVKFSRI